MPLAHVFDLSQLFGYAALVLGISAFLQKRDRRFKFLNASQSLVYAIHFGLLGNISAATSALISSTRSFVSLRSQSLVWVAFFIVLNLGLGVLFAVGILGWLPVIASCFSTAAIFLLREISLRLVLLVCTFMWLANNIYSGSIGGTVLEVIIATVNTSTIVRLALDKANAGQLRREGINNPQETKTRAELEFR